MLDDPMRVKLLRMLIMTPRPVILAAGTGTTAADSLTYNN